ncbi:MAG: mechanosensitive ion channel family protein [Candidatus Krumholzibacteriota bacterium]|nr:mechanosensitive ion channel family protein [Candidatus Krumholzibacteriota bacterium]
MGIDLESLGVSGWLSPERLMTLVRILLILLVGILLARLAGRGAARIALKRGGPQAAMVMRRLVYWPLLAIVLVMVLHQLGFKLGVLLGAAGVLTVAIGFASQTSASNLISGLFLIAERPFVVGDIIQVAEVTGQVLSIDLLSVKLRTFDNLFVRVPNEEIIKTRVTNLTHFPIRRVDLQVGVAYKEDLGAVKDILFEVADRNPLCLDQPAPLFIFKGYGSSSLDMQFSVWAKRENYLELRNGIYLEIKRAFDERGVEIPFPHVSLYAGSATEPLPVRLAEREDRPPRDRAAGPAD